MRFTPFFKALRFILKCYKALRISRILCAFFTLIAKTFSVCIVVVWLRLICKATCKAYRFAMVLLLALQ